MGLLFFHAVADLVLMCKHKIKIIRPSGMTRDHFWRQIPVAKYPLQFYKRLFCQFIVLCQGIDKTVPAIGTEPDRIARKQVSVINKIDHMTPCMAGHEDRFNLDIIDIKNVSVLQQFPFIVAFYHGELIQAEDHFAAPLSRHIAIFDLTDVQFCFRKQAVTVSFNRSDMIGILMCDQYMLYRGGCDTEPLHLFLKSVIVISGIDHDRRAVLRVEKDIRDPLTDTRNMLIYPSGI